CWNHERTACAVVYGTVSARCRKKSLPLQLPLDTTRRDRNSGRYYTSELCSAHELSVRGEPGEPPRNLVPGDNRVRLQEADKWIVHILARPATVPTQSHDVPSGGVVQHHCVSAAIDYSHSSIVVA